MHLLQFSVIIIILISCTCCSANESAGDDDDFSLEVDWKDNSNDFNAINKEHHANNDDSSKENNGYYKKSSSLIEKNKKLIGSALAKILKNKIFKRKFVEIVPILRVLSAPQRTAFAALITTQLGASPGHDLKLKEVEPLFEDSRKLILPIVFDIASLIKNAAKNVTEQMNLDSSYNTFNSSMNPNRRNDENEQQILYNDYEYEDVLNPMTINEHLYGDLPRKRLKRSTNLPGSNKAGSLKDSNGQKLGISDSGFNPLNDAINKTEDDLMTEFPEISIEEEIEEDFRLDHLHGEENFLNTMNNDSQSEPLPKPESLTGPIFRKGGHKFPIPKKKNIQRRYPPNIERIPSSIGSCERFSSTMCLRSQDYPMQQIMGSIRRHRHAMSALLAEYSDKKSERNYHKYLEDSLQRREDDTANPGHMCSSVVRYARPQKARSATGEWKYIVNTGQHTQTLRLEKCSSTQDSCSYLTENYRSRCTQVYNYHRLLSWDKVRGLHVDIFKVPTCCSCHVDGYRDVYPPLSQHHVSPLKDYARPKKRQPYHPSSEYDLDEEDEEESNENPVVYKYTSGLKKSNKYDTLYSGSSKNEAKSHQLGVYLNAPYSTFDPKVSFQSTLNSRTQNIRELNSFPDQYSDNYRTRIQDRADQHATAIDRSDEKPTSHFNTFSENSKRKKHSEPSFQIPANREIYTSSSAPILTYVLPEQSSPKIPSPRTEDSKHINYNYHPIIDFFEKQVRPVLSSPLSIARQDTNIRGHKAASHVHDHNVVTQSNWRPVIFE